MNGWKQQSWKQASWGNSWGAVIVQTLNRLTRIVKMPARFIPFPLFKR